MSSDFSHAHVNELNIKLNSTLKNDTSSRHLKTKILVTIYQDSVLIARPFLLDRRPPLYKQMTVDFPNAILRNTGMKNLIMQSCQTYLDIDSSHKHQREVLHKLSHNQGSWTSRMIDIGPESGGTKECQRLCVWKLTHNLIWVPAKGIEIVCALIKQNVTKETYDWTNHRDDSIKSDEVVFDHPTEHYKDSTMTNTRLLDRIAFVMKDTRSIKNLPRVIG